MNPRIHNHYLNTVFQFIPTGKPSDFWVITAYNPGGKEVNPGDNLDADAELHEHLSDAKLKPFRVTGLSPDESHAEPGWGIACDESTALKIARKFKQLAVYHFSGGQIDLVNCSNGKSEALEDPASRIHNPQDLRHFTLWVGSPGAAGRIGPLEHAGVCTRVGALFANFTIQRGEGCFRSQFEDTFIIHLATREPLKVIEVAQSLRCFLNQDGIGISHNGIYQRIRDWSESEVILEAFGLI